MKIEQVKVDGKDINLIRVSNPDKPYLPPKPFCQPGQVDGMIEKLTRYVAADPANTYYKELLALLEEGEIPFVA